MKCFNPGLAIINGQVVTIGGWREGRCTKDVWTWNMNEWEHLNDMEHERSDPGVITSCNYVTVISGKGTQDYEDNWIDSVEVYDVNEGSWKSVCPLLSPYTGIEVTLCNDTLYVFPDQYRQGVKCNLYQLISSTENDNPEDLWDTFTNCPLRYTSPVTVGNHVVCIGGTNAGSNGLKDVYLYKETSNSWGQIGYVNNGRMYSMVEVCENRLVVVGGVRTLTKDRDASNRLSTMEIYTPDN